MCDRGLVASVERGAWGDNPHPLRQNKKLKKVSIIK